MVNKAEILDAIELAYFVPALILSIFVVLRQGLSREAGWIFLTILSLARTISGSTGIAAVYKPSVGLITASIITASIGSAALVASLTGIANRVNAGTGRKALSPRTTKLLQMLGLTAVILGIVGGIKQTDSDPSTQQDGHTYTKVAAILILIQFLASSFITFYSLINISSVQHGDRRLLFLSLISLPFILVRCIWSIAAAFNPGSHTFSLISDSLTAVVVRAIMLLLMEFIVVALFLFGGLTSPRVEKPTHADISTATADTEMNAREPQFSNVANEPPRYHHN